MLSGTLGKVASGKDVAILGSRFAVLQDAHTEDHMDADTVADFQAEIERIDTDMGKGEGIVKFSMARDISETGVRSATYRKSNPERQGRHVVNIDHTEPSIDVIPLIEGSEIAIDSHELENSAGAHRVLSVRENFEEAIPDWIQSTTNQLQAVAYPSRDRLGRENVMEEDGREADSPRVLLGSKGDLIGGLGGTDKRNGDKGLSLQ
ncbi:hypothetical protein V6N13_082062 [Hibiscus sabdariffa]|uniref:Uncharacterized protein n=1 Tax=Hibiscus sabdariffa TaxID=183260 RepID=A0ABR2DCZ3_9ROSI